MVRKVGFQGVGGKAGAERIGSTRLKRYPSSALPLSGSLLLSGRFPQVKLEQSARVVPGLSSTPAAHELPALRQVVQGKAGAEHIGSTRLKRYPSNALLLSGSFPLSGRFDTGNSTEIRQVLLRLVTMWFGAFPKHFVVSIALGRCECVNGPVPFVSAPCQHCMCSF